MMYEAKRRKPMNKKGRAPIIKKTSHRELTAIERAFIAGACIAGSPSHNDCANIFPHGVASKSTITRTVQRVNERAIELNTTIIDPRCYEFQSTRGAPRLLDDEQRARVVELTIASQKSREKESWQAIKDGDFVNAGLPNFSVSLHENIMYNAGYARRRPGWKPPLNDEQKRERLEWALVHNPDKDEYGDGKGFDFTQVIFTDETPARIGEERGMQRVWCKNGEQYDEGVKKDRNRRACCLQFYGAFRYDYKGPCYTYFQETAAEKQLAEEALEKENKQRKHDDNTLQRNARKALEVMQESDINHRYNTRKKQYVPSEHDYKRGGRENGGVDGYRHREGALKSITPWINSLKKKEIPCLLLQDGAPAHKSRIARDYCTVERIERMWWPGHSPDINASEHAWPWIRRHVTRDFTPSCTEAQCKRQWGQEWDAIPIEVINKWVMAIPEVVRRIIKHGGNNDFYG
jgi:transposase